MNDDNNNLSVGQVVYLCSKKEARVYPALVSEEINKTTLEGRSTSYVVKLPTDDAREVSLETVDAEVFTSIKSARDEMLLKASNQIDMILSNASELAYAAFNIKDTAEENINLAAPDKDNSSNDGYATVDLGDGVVGKIDLETLSKIGAE